MTDDRLLAVKNATCEAIDHLHKSLESCPHPEAEAPDPKGIKVDTPSVTSLVFVRPLEYLKLLMRKLLIQCSF